MKTKFAVVLFVIALTSPVPALAFDFNSLSSFMKGVVIDVGGQVLGSVAKKVYEGVTQEAPPAAVPGEIDNSNYAELPQSEGEFVETAIKEMTLQYPDDQQDIAKRILLQRFADLAVQYPSAKERMRVLGYRLAEKSARGF